jgi:predicted amidohydrolase
MTEFRIAVAQYPIEFLADFAAYEQKLERWVAEAAGLGAKILVFPEYGAMELVSILPEDIRPDLQASVDGLMAYWPQYDSLHKRLAARYNVYILGASFPKDRANIAGFYAPDGTAGYQGKLIMTRFENEEWRIMPTREQTLFNTPFGKIGVAICYDSEFPLLVRGLVEAGAVLILVPSCTDTLAGYNRVRIGAQARALENQCYVVQSPTVGEAPWSPATDVNIGAAGIFAPPDVGFPDDGVIAQGELNQAGWVYADLNLARIDSIRRHGRVLNHRDWERQV